MRSDFKGTSGKTNRLKRCPGIICHSKNGYFDAVFQASKAFHAFIIQRHMVLHPDQIPNVASSALNPEPSERKPSSPTQTNCLKSHNYQLRSPIYKEKMRGKDLRV